MAEPINKKTTLFITASGSFLTPFMGSSVNIALPSMGRELAMDAIQLSWVSTGYLLSAAMFLVPLGRVADIHGRKKIFSAGIFVFTFCSFFLGFGFGLFSSPNTNAVMSAVEKKFYGASSSIVATMRLVGQMLSMGMGTLLFSLYIGRVQITPPYYSLFLQSVRTAFLIFAFLCTVGFFASLARGRIREKSLANRTGREKRAAAPRSRQGRSKEKAI